MKKIFRHCSILALGFVSLCFTGHANDTQSIPQTPKVMLTKCKESAIFAQASNVSKSHIIAPNAHVPFDTLNALKGGITYHKSKGEFTVHESGLYMVSYFVISAPVALLTTPTETIQQFGVKVNGHLLPTTVVGYRPQILAGFLQQEHQRRAAIRFASIGVGATLLTLTPTIIHLKKKNRVRLVNTSQISVTVGSPTITPSGSASVAFFLQKM